MSDQNQYQDRPHGDWLTDSNGMLRSRFVAAIVTIGLGTMAYAWHAQRQINAARQEAPAGESATTALPPLPLPARQP